MIENNIIEVNIIRHGVSTANEYNKKYNMFATDEKYINSGLSKYGKFTLKILKEKMLEDIGNSDFIFTSPLKRAIETCLMVYNLPIDKNIEILPLVTEIGYNLIENKGVPLLELQNDEDLNKMNNYNKIIFDSNSVYYNYGWKNELGNPIDWIDLDSDVLKYPFYRIIQFKLFLSNPIFRGKKITIFSHSNFILKLTNKKVNNLGKVTFKFNPSNNNFYDINGMNYMNTTGNFIKNNKIIDLERMKYIDKLELNKLIIYRKIYNNLNFNLVRLTTNLVLYRGFNNKNCLDLAIPPGSKKDNYKNNPIWFGPPEVAILYSVRNISDTMLKRIYSDYSTNKINDLSDTDIYKLCNIIFENNISSNLAYSINKDCELLDINNTQNLDNIINLFKLNFTYEKYMDLYKLNRITTTMINYLHSILKYLPINKCSIFPDFDRFKDNDKNKYLYFNKIGTLILSNFLLVFNYKDYLIFNNEKKIFINRYELDKKNKYKLPKQLYLNNYSIRKNIYNNPFPDDLTNYDNIKLLRKNEFVSSKTEYDKYINNINNINTLILQNKENEKKIIDKLNNKIDNTILKDTDFINKNKTNITNFKNNEIADIKKKINEIRINKSKGIIFKFFNGELGLYKVTDGYKVYLDFDYTFKRKYYNPSIEEGNSNASKHDKENCKLCKFARTRNWINQCNKERTLSNKFGLSYNLTYYEYNPGTDNIDKVGFAFKQMFNKELNNLRILTIPYDHLPTMYHNNNCNINSNYYKPNGSYSPNIGFNCGASIFEDCKDAEILNNMINTLKTSLLFGYKKFNKKFVIGNLNYDNNPRFYKYYKEDENPYNGNNIPLYLLFHTKANSEPHLHMHTYYDKDFNSLRHLIESNRIINKSFYLDKVNKNKLNIDNIDLDILDIDNIEDFKLDDIEDIEGIEDINLEDHLQQTGGKIQFLEEIFGIKTDNKYKIFDHQYGNYIYLNGSNLLDTNKYEYIDKTYWKDEFNIKSNIYNHDTYFAGSFEYLFKRMMGIKDSDKLMKAKFIFPEPDYEIDTYHDQGELLETIVKNDFSQLLKKNYEISKTSKFDDYNYIDYKEDTAPRIIQAELLEIDEIKYGQNSNNTISRNSTIINDNIMLLCLQIALFNIPNIGGYYGHSAPVFNNYNNITHPEICLFNSIDYKFKLIKNAKFSTCNLNENNNKYNIYIKIAVLYYIKYYNQYNKKIYINDENEIISLNKIDDFFNPDLNQHGGDANYTDFKPPSRLQILPTNKKLDIGPDISIKKISDFKPPSRLPILPTNKKVDIGPDKSINNILDIGSDISIEKISDFDFNILLKNRIKDIIKLINTEDIKELNINDSDIEFIIIILKCIHYNIEPTNGQFSNLENN
jgi:hypothetical protein